MPSSGTMPATVLTDLLFDRADAGRCLVAPDGTVVRANAMWLRCTGLSLDQVLGGAIVDLLPGARDVLLAPHARARAGHHVEVPRQMRMIEGRETWWEGRIDPVPVEGGAGLLITMREVCPDPERPAFEYGAADFLERMREGFFALDREWRFVYVNAVAEKVLGIRRTEVLGRSHWEVFPLTLGTNLEAEYRRAAGGEARDFENHYAPWDRWFHNSCYPRVGGGMTVFFRDITDQKRAVEALQRQDAQFRALIENLHSGVALIDSAGKFSLFNRRFLDIFGLPQDGDILGVNSQDWAAWRVFAEDGSLLEVDAHPVRKAVLTRQPVRNQAVAVQLPKGGDLKWLLVSAEPLLASDGAVDKVICTYHEITSLKRAAAEARDAHQRLRAHVEATPLGLIEWDSEYRVTRFSRRAQEILGWTADEVVGRRIDEIPWVPEEEWPAIRELMRDMATGARATTVNANRNLRKDGSPIFCEWYSSTIHDEAGRLGSVFSLMLDVTARTRAEAALAESRKKLETALASMTDAVLISDTEGRFVDFNDAFATFHRFASKDQCKRTLAEYPDFLEVFLPTGVLAPLDQWAVPRALRGETVTNAEYRLRRKDTGETWVGSYSFAPIRDASGAVVGSVVVGRDITAQKRAEEEVLASERRLRALADSMPQLAWTAGPDGHITWYNRRWYEYTGTTPAEMAGSGWQRVHDPAALPEVLRRWEQSIATGADFTMEFPLRGADGNHRRFLTRVSPLKDHDGKVLQWFGTHTDVTELVEAQEALREADRRKDEFLALLGHELRNPLAPIRNAAHILEHVDGHSEQAARARGVLRRQSEHLTRLVDDLLDVTRITRGKITLQRSRLDLREAVTHCAEDFRPTMAGRGIAFRLELPDGAVWAEADATRINQVLANLLHNAAKFTPRGGEVAVALRRDGDTAEIRVHDTGSGIDPALLPRLFRVFVQGQQTLARTEGGLGLGLALVKGIADLHGGEVRAESAGVGKGADFIVRLPAGGPA